MNLEVPPTLNMSTKFSILPVPPTIHYLNLAKFNDPATYLSLLPNVEVSPTNLETLPTLYHIILAKFSNPIKYFSTFPSLGSD